MKITIALLLLLLLIPNPLSAQANPPPVATAKKAPVKKAKPPETGELTGFVFLITKAGDLKPARLAHIVLLYMHRNGIGPDENYGPSVAFEYLADTIHTDDDLQVEYLKSQLSYNTPMSDEAYCQAQLRSNIAALALAVKWAATEKHLEQVQTTDADEEGHFKLSGVPPGDYTLTASGQAGMNVAYWKQDDVVITAGQTTSVKLSSPEKACLAQ